MRVFWFNFLLTGILLLCTSQAQGFKIAKNQPNSHLSDYLIQILKKYGLNDFYPIAMFDISSEPMSSVDEFAVVKKNLLEETFKANHVVFHGITSRFRTFSLVFLHDCEAIGKFIDFLSNNKKVIKGRFVVIMSNDNCVSAMFDIFWQLLIVNVIAVHQNKDNHVISYTYLAFQEAFCDGATTILLHNSTKFPSHIDFFPNKVRNMHKCPVKVALFEDAPGIMMQKKESGDYEIHGKDALLLKFLADRMNFTIKVVVPENQWASISRDGENVTGGLKMLLERTAQMTVGAFVPTPALLNMFTRSRAYEEQVLLWLVPIKDGLGPFERLFDPIYNEVGIILVVFLGTLTLFLYTLTYSEKCKKYKNFILGRNIQTPSLSWFAIFVGSCAHTTPRRNFARFVFISWIFFTFFFRIIYEGHVISSITSQGPDKIYNSLHELIDAGYNFVTYDINKDFLVAIKDKSRIFEYDIHDPYGFPKYFESKKLFALLVYHDKLMFFNKYINNSLPFYIVKKRFLAFSKSIYLYKFSVLGQEIDFNIKDLRNNGLIIHWNQAVTDKYFEKYHFPRKYEPFGMKHLSGSFYLLIAGLTLALVAFIGEHIRYRWYYQKAVKTSNVESITLN